jgi:dTDP-4-amino-4,6-dideoxygalactose transaminase
MTTIQIPFNKPAMMGHELDYIADAVRSGKISGDATYSKKCHALLEDLLGVPKVLLTPSCTHALEMSALLLDLEPGDEVIIPAFTFVSTVNAFVLRGAKPIFADIRPDTLNLDETKLEALITPRTRAVVPVHYAGVGCAMDKIMAISARHGLTMIEDNAHGLFGKYQGKPLGTFGALATQSFHETKNFTCGEGGALLINDPALIDRAEIVREKGTNRSRFFRGMVDKYTWVDLGSSYLLSDVLAAYLYAQLEMREEVQRRRAQIFTTYDTQLQDWAALHDVRLPILPAECKQSYHMFYMLLPSLKIRTALIDHLKAHGILSVFHYLPLHLSEMGQQFGGKAGDCPVTEDISDRLLRLPFYNDLSEDEQARVIAALYDFEEWE